MQTLRLHCFKLSILNSLSNMTHFLKKFLFLLTVVVSTQSLSAQTYDDAFEAMQLENWDKAISICNKLVQADATDQNSWLSLSNAYLAKGDQKKAIEVLDQGFKAKPEGNLALVINGRTLLLQNQAAEADEQLQRAAKKGKKDPNVQRHIGESYLFYKAQGDTKPNLTRAEQLLKLAYEAFPRDFATCMSLGYAFREQGNGGEAARHFEFALASRPKSPLPNFMKATVYRAGRIPKKYLEQLNESIALDNNYSPALRAKADHLFLTRKWADALVAYKELLEKGKETTIEDEMQYANTLFLTKDYKGTADLVEKIIAKDGTKNYLRRLLGYSYYENGDYPKGRAIMDEYFKIVAPEKIIASDYTYMGRLQLKGSNDTMACIENLKKAIAKDTAEWGLNEEVAGLYYNYKAKNTYCEAAYHYQIFADSMRENTTSTVYYRMGDAYERCKTDSLRYEKALKNYLIVAEKAPTSPSGWLRAALAAGRMDPLPDSTNSHLATYGKARPYWEKYIDIAKADPAKNGRFLSQGYYYLAYCNHFIDKNSDKARELLSAVLAYDATNTLATGLLNEINGGAPAVAPDKPKNK
jgi:predicted negative regulator of RcsB-dependent stress response